MNDLVFGVAENGVPFPAMTGDEKRCPACLHSWVGSPIHEDDRKFYGGQTNYSLLVGVEVRGKGDRVNHWNCPFCKTNFLRA